MGNISSPPRVGGNEASEIFPHHFFFIPVHVYYTCLIIAHQTAVKGLGTQPNLQTCVWMPSLAGCTCWLSWTHVFLQYSREGQPVGQGRKKKRGGVYNILPRHRRYSTLRAALRSQLPRSNSQTGWLTHLLNSVAECQISSQ